MINEKMRREFEARFPVPSGVAWSDDHQNYGWIKKSAFQKTITYRAIFTGWQASRESLVIELPKRCEKLDGIAVYSEEGDFYHRHDVREAIESAGLKVKP